MWAYSLFTELPSQLYPKFLSFLLYLCFFLPNISNPHTPTLECMNLSRLHSDRWLLNVGPENGGIDMKDPDSVSQSRAYEGLVTLNRNRDRNKD